MIVDSTLVLEHIPDLIQHRKEDTYSLRVSA